MADKPKKSKPGPEPERLKIDMSFEDAVKFALNKKRPPGGWPKAEAVERKKKGQKP